MSEFDPAKVLKDLSPEAAIAILQAQGHLRMVPDLTLGLMHRLNNIMTSVSFTLEAAELEIPPQSPASELLAALGESIRDAQQVIHRTSEVNYFLGSTEVEYFDLNCSLQSDQDLFRFVLPKGADLKVIPAPEPLIVRASTSSLRSIMLPLLGNAGRASGEDCRVEIRCLPADLVDWDAYLLDPIEISGRMVAISVLDNGCGLDQRSMESLFRPFGSAAAGHAGLGLFSANRVARELGGAVGALRKCEVGAEFLVLLPRILE